MNKDRRNFLKSAAIGVSASLCGVDAVASEAPREPVVTEPHPAPLVPSHLADYVNVLQGTNSSPSYSRGNTLPIVAAPFGMAHWTIQTTSERGNWFFHPADPRFEGVRCTHQLAPWLGDYGHLVVLPFSGNPDFSPNGRASSYRPQNLHLTPYCMHVELRRYSLTIDLVPTERCCMMELTFEKSGPAGLCIAIPGNKGGAFVTAPTPGSFIATSPSNQGGVAKDFAAYYAISIDTPAQIDFKQMENEGIGTLRFDVKVRQKVQVRIGSSFISAQQAQLNLNREIGTISLDRLRDQTAEVWEKQLGRIRIVEPDQTRNKIFYSSLYRTSLFPRIWHEVDATGETVHRSPYNGSVEKGVMYADHGFWDVYRAWYPMMTLIYPDRLAEILQAWSNAVKEGGWLPQFPCPGYRGAMSGSPIDTVFADAAVKNIKGFDLETAYGALRKHATTPQKIHFGYGRQGVEDYLALGYLPSDKHGGALTESLDAAYGDFCIGQVARVLGHDADAQMFDQRSQNWHKVFDPETKFLRARLSDGQWPKDFLPIRWGDGYVEGSAWQYRVSVPHDPEGLISAMGGKEAFVEILDQLTTMPPVFDVGDYGFEIHEMSEMAAVNFGQYAHSNQPSHHILYMYAMAGRPDRTQYWVRQVLTELYSVDDFAGDEDTGSMAAWYILSSLGFYSLCPGRPSYVLGSPLFQEAVLHLPAGITTRIKALNQAPGNPYVSTCTFNGKPITSSLIDHAALASGGDLVFKMQNKAPYRTSQARVNLR
jgi:predicted alpha-1,2-mannosidase